MDGKDFSQWLDSRNLNPAQAAELFGGSEQNIYNWRSTRGVPESKAEWVRKMMAEYDSKETGTLPNRIILEPSREQFRAWGKAALIAGKLIDDWATESLDQFGAQEEATNQTGSTAAPNPLYPPLAQVAEEGNEYRGASGAKPGDKSPKSNGGGAV